MFTFVFISFHSGIHIKRLISSIEKKYPIIVIENSLDVELKNELEGKYDNVKVIIPSKNNGISVGYNIAIKESKTNFVFLNSADIVLSKKCIVDLEECVSKIKDFAILAATYDDETIYKNYDIWNSKALTTNFSDETYKKHKIKEVDYIDNDFIINKSNFKDIGFSMKSFLCIMKQWIFVQELDALTKKFTYLTKLNLHIMVDNRLI